MAVWSRGKEAKLDYLKKFGERNKSRFSVYKYRVLGGGVVDCKVRSKSFLRNLNRTEKGRNNTRG